MAKIGLPCGTEERAARSPLGDMLDLHPNAGRREATRKRSALSSQSFPKHLPPVLHRAFHANLIGCPLSPSSVDTHGMVQFHRGRRRSARVPASPAACERSGKRKFMPPYRELRELPARRALLERGRAAVASPARRPIRIGSGLHRAYTISALAALVFYRNITPSRRS